MGVVIAIIFIVLILLWVAVELRQRTREDHQQESRKYGQQGRGSVLRLQQKADLHECQRFRLGLPALREPATNSAVDTNQGQPES